VSWAAVNIAVRSAEADTISSLVACLAEVASCFKVASHSNDLASQAVAGAVNARSVVGVECAVLTTVLDEHALIIVGEGESLMALVAR